MNILFICSRNQWRSPTAEAIFKNHAVIKAKSAGTENAARIRVTEKLILWADIIYVMECKHKQRLHQRFEGALTGKNIQVLDIPDNYKYMDPELIEELKSVLQPLINSQLVTDKKTNDNPDEKYND